MAPALLKYGFALIFIASLGCAPSPPVPGPVAIPVTPEAKPPVAPSAAMEAPAVPETPTETADPTETAGPAETAEISGE